jgi:hypothetical protein
MRIVTSAAAMLLAILAGCVVAPPVYQAMPVGPPPPVQYQPAPEQYSDPPPPLPVYEQPPLPAPGYLWIPGVWRMGPAGYFWVPGTWVLPPAPALLWTPGFWALAGAIYVFHIGYWGPHVGYYGGINYGHGYYGNGYAGGRWVNNTFNYNTAVTNVNVTNVHNTYNETVVNNVNVTNVTNVTRVSYVGGPGTRSVPTPEESAAAREAHFPPTAVQVQHQLAASAEPTLSAARNGGRPPIAATPRPTEFNGTGVTTAQSGGPAYRPPGQGSAPGSPLRIVHARDLPGSANGSAAASPVAQQQSSVRAQADLQARHDQERQTLAQQQEREHSSFPQQPVHDHQAYEAMEKQHQQQTQQLAQRHQQESEQVSKGAAPHSERDTPH